MKKILFAIPFLFLFAFTSNNGLVLDSAHGNKFRFSIHYKASNSFNMEQRYVKYYQDLITVLNEMKKRGYKYVAREYKTPLIGDELDAVLLQKNKPIVITFGVAGLNKQEKVSYLIDKEIVGLDKLMKTHMKK